MCPGVTDLSEQIETVTLVECDVGFGRKGRRYSVNLSTITEQWQILHSLTPRTI